MHKNVLWGIFRKFLANHSIMGDCMHCDIFVITVDLTMTQHFILFIFGMLYKNIYIDCPQGKQYLATTVIIY